MRMFEEPRMVQPKPPPPTYQFHFELKEWEVDRLKKALSVELLRKKLTADYNAVSSEYRIDVHVLDLLTMLFPNVT